MNATTATARIPRAAIIRQDVDRHTAPFVTRYQQRALAAIGIRVTSKCRIVQDRGAWFTVYKATKAGVVRLALVNLDPKHGGGQANAMRTDRLIRQIQDAYLG